MNINDYQKLWTPSIQGLFGEPARCFTYQPLGPRNVGFANNVIISWKNSIIFFQHWNFEVVSLLDNVPN